MASTPTRAATWPGFGLVAGAGIGVMLMALTGSIMWIVFLGAAGLLLGLAAGSLRDAGSTDDQPN